MRYFFPLTALVVSLLATSQPVRAQSDVNVPYDAQKRLTVSTVKFPEARLAVNAFLRRRAAWVQKQEETPEQLVAEFTIPLPALPALDSLAASLGYVLENNLNTQNLTEQLNTLRDAAGDARLSLVRLEAEQRKVQALPRPDTAQVRIYQYRVDNARATLRRAQRQVAALAAHDSLAFVALRVFDEITFPTANRAVNFVNMPGVEAGLLRLENPKAGVTARFYRGYSVKYLFTRGKSYFNVGIYKPITKAEAVDSTFISEIFLINFGQDFYPRHFGRGQRKFLNLYTTYQIGGAILNRQGEDDARFIPNANLGIGLELLKTKNILLDTKASYFLPLHHLNRELRGLLLQGALNFVF